jgi:hypothetical protein
MKTIPFIISSKNKILRIYLTKKVKDFCNENYKPLKKETKKDIRRWKDLPCSLIGRINIVEILYYQKQFTCSMPSPTKF